MLSTRLAFRLSIGIGVLALCAAAPSTVGDGRLPPWLNLLDWAKHTSVVQRIEGVPQRIAANVGGLSPRHSTPGGTSRSDADATGTPFAPPTPVDPVRTLGLDPTGLREGLAFYKAGSQVLGDAAARTATDPIVRTALEWVALRGFPPHQTGFGRLQAFERAHPTWPAFDWLHHRLEEAQLQRRDPAALRSFFTISPPETVVGKLAFAHFLEADGKAAEAALVVKTLWRDSDLSGPLETKVKTEFAAYLDKADDKFRADRLLYKEETGAALRAAAMAGPDVLALAKVRAAALNGAVSDKVLATVPAALRNDPGLLFAKIHWLRHANKIREAAALMLSAPRNPIVLVNGDEWWVERRLLARKLLDLGDAKTAYKLCAEHSAASREMRIEAEFHAGWIALRFLSDPALAAPHFTAAAALARTPMSSARAAYWQGRTAEASIADDAVDRARAFYEKAAAEPSTYYGQLALERLGRPLIADDRPPHEATGSGRDAVIRVIELFNAVGERDAALSLTIEAARHLEDRAQIAALATLVDKEHDAHLSLVVGKLLARRGMAIDALAYPTYGIPLFDPLQNSAARSVVYSVARQESAFDPKAVSSAGAKGLMQMIASTARRTAQRAGLAFDESRLLSDAAFNAQLGAAHLGALLNEQGGSYILTFAAYNAGGGRVKQWIDAYGDPRTPGVDPIDWVERIPFTETRNYVQRCLENLAMYQARFGEGAVVGREGDPRVEAKL